MPKPKKRKSFVNVRVNLAGQLPVVAEQPASSTSEVVMLAGEVVAHKSEFKVQVEAAVKKHAEACENASAYGRFGDGQAARAGGRPANLYRARDGAGGGKGAQEADIGLHI